MPQTLVILPTVNDRPDDIRYVIADETLVDAELKIHAVLNRLSAEDPQYTWETLAIHLEAAGFAIPRVTIAARTWNEKGGKGGIKFFVRFPADAAHEFAGMAGTASDEIDGFVRIVLEDRRILTGHDRPYARGQEGLEQVPLGQVDVPREQFASEAEYTRAINALRGADFECAA
ncbi:hypothetical protein [Burkholderia sp. MBR-1]|uniref:hypothetical protein n=1 Tax=Burkholderia sp. MBR-1 TaxID=2732364 RepID=UPI0015EF7812|nr:hypothetical protein [Burkholderia sp. MBR-1]QMI49696.1 hypothetical protein MBR110_29880 [Burkholderia sp. MBR-1]